MSILFNRLKDYTWNNPILLTEITRNLRQSKIVIIQTIYLSILSTVVYIVWAQSSSYRFDPAYAGKDIFNAILFFQYIAVTLLCPAFTCADISSEIEKQSFDLLITSLLSSKEIMLGKLGSTVTHIGLFLLSSLPVMCMVFYFGGISIVDILLAYLFILVIAIFYSIMGLFMSARIKKTSVSIAVTYGIALILFIFTGPFFDRLFSYDASFFSTSVDLFIFEIPLWLIFILEILSISLLFFLTAAYLIQSPVPRRTSLISVLFTVFYIVNILLFALKRCNDHFLGVTDMESFYQFFFLISLGLLPFFVWPGDWYINKEKFSFSSIFCFNNRFTMFFIPFMTLAGLILSSIIFICSSITMSQTISASVIIVMFIYFLSSAGRWVSHFFDKEEQFLLTFLAICWVPVILSTIIIGASYNNTSDLPLIIQVLQPVASLENLFNGVNSFSVTVISVIIYFIGSIIFNVMVYMNWPGKKVD